MNPKEVQIDVLILGGPELVREALTRRLNDEPTTNVIEYDGNGGPICALSSLSPDAIVVDLDDMPVVDGMSFSNWVMRTHPAMGVVLMMPIGDQSFDEDEAHEEPDGDPMGFEGAAGNLDDLISSVHAVAWGDTHIAIHGFRTRANALF